MSIAIYAALTAIGAFIYMVACWIMYLTVMNMKANKDKVESQFVYWLGRALFGLALAMNMVLNLLVYTILYVDLPRELLATDRMDRYKKKGKGWRCTMATWKCTNLLNPFDPKGEHC